MVNNTNQLDNNLETYQEILKSDRDYQNFIETGNEYVKCYDRLGIEITGITYTEDEVRRIAYNAYNYGQLDDPSEGKFNKFFSESKKTL